ncbi:MAG: tetratricopeptide repeat protein [Geminicoccaceae bacterium]
MSIRDRIVVAWFVVITSLLTPGDAFGDQRDLRLPSLFERLQRTANPSEASLIAHLIREIWLEFEDPRIQEHLMGAVGAMSKRDVFSALSRYDRIIEQAPEFAEGWNKRANVHLLLGNLDASVRDIQQTLALEPRHFDALSRLGIIYDRLEMPAAALRCFEAASNLHPHLSYSNERAHELRDQLAGEPL